MTGVPTINRRVDYPRPAGDGGLMAHAGVVRAGRGSAVVDVDVAEGNGALTAVGRVIYGTKSR